MKILEAISLVKKFDEFVAVDDVSFFLKSGEILGIIGPNGAGKTTIIQMLLGLLTTTAGEIKYFGKSFKNHRSEILEYVNFSSSYITLPWRLTVKESLTFVSYLYNIKNRNQQLQYVVDTFHLEDLLKKEIYQLSSGQQTRVNLAKAFLNNPKVLFLDEPTASLDLEVASYIREFLLHARKNFNVSIIITSHNMGEVEKLCDRIILINHGKIIANNTPENLIADVMFSHMELLFKYNISQAEEFLKQKNISYTRDGKYFFITIKEKEVAVFLQNLAQNNLHFEAISIEKPTLEDYFLAMTKHSINPLIKEGSVER